MPSFTNFSCVRFNHENGCHCPPNASVPSAFAISSSPPPDGCAFSQELADRQLAGELLSSMTMYKPGPYQLACEEFALYGDPLQEHLDYEEASRFDRFDGFGDPDPYAGEDGWQEEADEDEDEYDALMAEEYAAHLAAGGSPSKPAPPNPDDEPF
jgi:hypothetical protein